MKSLRKYVVALLLGSASAVVAVETTPATPGQAPAAPVKDAPAAKEGSADDAKATQAAEKFGDWALVCPAPEADGKSKPEDCRLLQSAYLNVEGKDGKEDAKEGGEPRTQRVMLTAVGFVSEDKERQTVLSVIVPLGVHLPPGLKLEVEGEEEMKISLHRCDASGCVGILPMKSSLIEGFRKGKDGHVTFYNIAGKASRVRLSFEGFGKAFDALSQRVKAN